MTGARRVKPERPMWPSPVVVRAIPGKDGPQVVFAEDEDAVGEFGSGGQDESFGEAVGSRTARWDLHCVDAGAGQDRVKGGGELAGAVAVEEVHSQHGRGLRAQEPPPGRVSGSQRRGWYPPPLEDSADGGCSDA